MVERCFLHWDVGSYAFSKYWISRVKGQSNHTNRAQTTGYSHKKYVGACGIVSMPTVFVSLFSLPEEKTEV